MATSMIASRQLLKRAIRIQPLSCLLKTRNSSTDVSIDLEESTGIAVVSMNKKPVNSLNLELLTDLNNAVQQLDNDRKCKGIILTSSLKVFCAGLDIMEMYQCKPDRVGEFWRSLQDGWITIYGSRTPLIACINGHSPAGGCLLATSCDYRIMAPNLTIGLNETKLGIVAPFWFKDTMNATIGHRKTEMSLMLGTLYSSEEALAIGMIDKISPQESILSDCRKEIAKWMQIPAQARYMSKLSMRKDTIDKLKNKKEDDIKFFVNFVTSEPVQKSLGLYLEALKKK